jgi:predicted regulator of amino acid metabolism with ACT domain
MAFIGPRPATCDIRHLDGNALNNNIENLCYGTRAENVQDALKHGTMYAFKKFNSDKIKEICHLGFTDISASEIAKKFGVSRGTIVDIWMDRVCETYTDGIRPIHRGKLKYDKLSDEELNRIIDISIPVRTLSRGLGIGRRVIMRCREKILKVTPIPQTTIYDRMTDEERAIVHDLTIPQRKAAEMLGVCRYVIVMGRKKLISAK